MEPERHQPIHNFTHLRVHSCYTFLGGTAVVEELAGRAADGGLTHLALTDNNGLRGAVVFTKACRELNIQPILGVAATVALPEDLAARIDGARVPSRLVLLATGPAGCQSLWRLCAT